MEGQIDIDIIERLVASIEAFRLPIKPSVMDSVLNLVELRVMILAELPLQALYRARKVCWHWRLQIDGSNQLQQLMYKTSIRPRGREHEVEFHYLSFYQSMMLVAPTITINPILGRTIVVPREGLIRTLATLDSRPSFRPNNKSFTENVLLWEPANCVEVSPEQILLEEDSRPFLYYREAVLPPKSTESEEGKPHRRQPLVVIPEGTVQPEWKYMLFCQPPLKELALMHPEKPKAWLAANKNGVTMYDILNALQHVFRKEDWPQDRELPGDYEEIEIMLPIVCEHGNEARNQQGMRICRALKTKLKCRFETAPGEWGQLYDPRRDPRMARRNAMG